MEHYASSGMVSDRRSRIPTVAWVMLAGLVAVLLAIWVFKVSIGTAVIYGFISLMVMSHLFMHGGHGAHSVHNDQSNSQADASTNTDQKSTHGGHSGCH